MVNSELVNPPVKKRRNRKSASCTPCKAQKLRCDRALPCSSCVNKGNSDGCKWEGGSSGPLFEVNRERNENGVLREEVDRLQKVVEELLAGGARLGGGGGGGGATSGNSSGGGGGEGRDARASTSLLPVVTSDAHVQEEEVDLASQDLARGLGHLTIKNFRLDEEEFQSSVSRSEQENEFGPESLVKEVQSMLNDSPSFVPTAASSSMPNIFSSLSFFPSSKTQSPTTTLELMTLLPSRPLATQISTYYFKAIDWYLHPIPSFIFTQHSHHVWSAKEDGKTADPLSLAICFAVWGVGLESLRNGSKTNGKAVQGQREDLARSWLELSSTALTIGRFLESPTLEAIRALLLLGTHYVSLSNGEQGSTGLAYIALTVQCCLQLRLHRDPDLTPGRFSPGKAEDRRRLFWATYLVDETASTTFGRRSCMLHLKDIDCKLPRDIPDEMMGRPEVMEGEEDTIMSSILHRIKICQLAEEISEKVFGLEPVSYALVMAYDQRLLDLKNKTPELYRFDSVSTYDVNLEPLRGLRCFIAHLAICQERLRLHRPYLSRSYTSPSSTTFLHSRQVCLRTAHEILFIQSSPLCAAPWCGLNYKAICACIILSLDCLFDPHGMEVRSQRDVVERAVERLEVFAKVSTVIRRGISIIRFMLAKLDPYTSLSYSPQYPERPPFQKRSRPSSETSIQTSSSIFLVDNDLTSFEDDDFTPRRKLPQNSNNSSSLAHTAQGISSFDSDTLLGLGIPLSTTQAPPPSSAYPPSLTFSPTISTSTSSSFTSPSSNFEFDFSLPLTSSSSSSIFTTTSSSEPAPSPLTPSSTEFDFTRLFGSTIGESAVGDVERYTFGGGVGGGGLVDPIGTFDFSLIDEKSLLSMVGVGV